MALYKEDDMKAFNGKEYLRTRYSGPPSPTRAQALKYLHEFFSKYSHTWNADSAHMLEYGGGPSIHGLIPACRFVKDVTFTDFAESARKEVELWRNKDKEGHNWLPHIEYVLTTLEGCTEPAAVATREAEIRRKIKEIVFSDIRSDDPLEKATLKTFDIISTMGCLESCSDSIEEFESAIKKLADMLNPNGYLIVLCVVDGKWWAEGDPEDKGLKFAVVRLEAADVLGAAEKAGLTIKEKHIVNNPKEGAELWDLKCLQFVVAQKGSC